MSGASTLSGLLCSSSVLITPAQLLNLVNAPIQLCAPSGPNEAALIKSLILSLRFGTTPFTQPSNAALVAYYGGPSRIAAWGSGGSQGPNFQITSVNGASGNTQYNGMIVGGANNAYAGLDVVCGGYTHSANTGTFLCVASTANSITLANSAGVAETAPFGAVVEIELPAGSWGCGIGGDSDLTADLLASQSQVSRHEVVGGNLPTSEVNGYSIVLGNPLPIIGSPANLIAGDSSLLATVEWLSVPL
jgi:hypothetical protein